MSANKRSRKAKDSVPTPPLPVADSPADFSTWEKVQSIFSAEISPLMVAAIIMLSASSVFAASFGVSQLDLDLGTGSLPPIHALPGRVLGASTVQNVIDDAALEAQDPSAALTAKAVSFDSTAGRWDYDINYSVSNLDGSATLTIGTYVVQSSITTSGTAETGAILKPNMTYHISLWDVDSSGNKQNLAHINLKTPRATGTSKTPTKPLPCAQLQNATSTPGSSASFCIKKDDGTIQCMPPVCGLYSPNQISTSTPPYFGHLPPMWATGTPGSVPPPPQGPQNQQPANPSNPPTQ